MGDSTTMAGNEPVDPAALTQCGATELGVAIPETGPQLAYSAEMEALDYPVRHAAHAVRCTRSSCLVYTGSKLCRCVYSGVCTKENLKHTLTW